MKKQQNTETPQNTTKTAPFLDKNMISANKNMKNKANLNRQKFTATSCSTVNYNDFSPKTQNGTKPNKANFRQVASKPWRRRMPISNTTKPSLLLGKRTLLGNLYLRNKPNFNHSNIIATSYTTVVYNDLQTKPKNGANPNKPNQSQFQKPKNHRFQRNPAGKTNPIKANLRGSKSAQFRLTLIAISVTVMLLSNPIRKEKRSNTKSLCYV